ncbi:hypothetical protein SEA_MISCHIEF19_68 [Streptomyces phage Mischief19]|nr:hypothetical protein SEA_MISCHIEF19_68 [Streptomyces phage Mischief19]
MSNRTGRRRAPRQPLYWWPSAAMWLLLALHVLDVINPWVFWAAFVVYTGWLVIIYRPNGVYGRQERRPLWSRRQR